MDCFSICYKYCYYIHYHINFWINLFPILSNICLKRTKKFFRYNKYFRSNTLESYQIVFQSSYSVHSSSPTPLKICYFEFFTAALKWGCPPLPLEYWHYRSAPPHLLHPFKMLVCLHLRLHTTHFLTI